MSHLVPKRRRASKSISQTRVRKRKMKEVEEFTKQIHIKEVAARVERGVKCAIPQHLIQHTMEQKWMSQCHNVLQGDKANPLEKVVEWQLRNARVTQGRKIPSASMEMLPVASETRGMKRRRRKASEAIESASRGKKMEVELTFQKHNTGVHNSYTQKYLNHLKQLWYPRQPQETKFCLYDVGEIHIVFKEVEIKQMRGGRQVKETTVISRCDWDFEEPWPEENYWIFPITFRRLMEKVSPEIFRFETSSSHISVLIVAVGERRDGIQGGEKWAAAYFDGSGNAKEFRIYEAEVRETVISKLEEILRPRGLDVELKCYPLESFLHDKREPIIPMGCSVFATAVAGKLMKDPRVEGWEKLRMDKMRVLKKMCSVESKPFLKMNTQTVVCQFGSVIGPMEVPDHIRCDSTHRFLLESLPSEVVSKYENIRDRT